MEFMIWQIIWKLQSLLEGELTFSETAVKKIDVKVVKYVQTVVGSLFYGVKVTST